MNTTIIISTDKTVHPRCLEAVWSQSVSDFNVLITRRAAVLENNDPIVAKELNIAANREDARKLALAFGSEHYLWLDSDVVMPPNALAELLIQAENSGKEAVSGYYPMRHSPHLFASGRLTPDGVVVHFSAIAPSLVQADFAGFGCMLVSRRLMELCRINSGTDKMLRLTDGQTVYFDDSVDFCEQLYQHGATLYMDGNVICEHLVAS
jgi:GT2 family glycosyltransferase